MKNIAVKGYGDLQTLLTENNIKCPRFYRCFSTIAFCEVIFAFVIAINFFDWSFILFTFFIIPRTIAYILLAKKIALSYFYQKKPDTDYGVRRRIKFIICMICAAGVGVGNILLFGISNFVSVGAFFEYLLIVSAIMFASIGMNSLMRMDRKYKRGKITSEKIINKFAVTNKNPGKKDQKNTFPANVEKTVTKKIVAMPRPVSVTSQLQELKSLQKQGLISEEDYEKKKNQILGI